MNIKKTELHGVLLVESDYHEDRRGSFIKVLSDINDTRRTLNITSREIYYSISKKNVIRGMHFQIPPKQHSKFVYLIDGKVRDVILDIRSDSPTYGNYIDILLKPGQNAIYIPEGCAHGFLSLVDNSIMVYNQSSTYSKSHDKGINVFGFGYDWEVDKPILSQRDEHLTVFSEFETPFK